MEGKRIPGEENIERKKDSHPMGGGRLMRQGGEETVIKPAKGGKERALKRGKKKEKSGEKNCQAIGEVFQGVRKDNLDGGGRQI